MKRSQHAYKRIYDIANSCHREWLSGRMTIDSYLEYKNQFKERGWMRLWRGAWKAIDASHMRRSKFFATDDIPF